MHSRLKIFISSTSDLQSERDTIERALSDLEIDGLRFESWITSPNPPLKECLERIEESDAVILVMGEKYGNMTSIGISATHAEFRKTIETSKPLFVFILDIKLPEENQKKFIKEVESSRWRGTKIKSIDDLFVKVRQSLLQEFTRCFKKIHTPPSVSSKIVTTYDVYADIELPSDPKEVFSLVEKLFTEGQDVIIHKLATAIETNFEDNIGLLFYLYMAEVNLGMDRYPVDENRIRRAIEFWNNDISKKIATKFSLDYNIGNAYLVLKQYGDAIEKFKESLKENQNFAECWKNLGTAYLEIGEIILAQECIDKAVQLNPSLFEALYSLGTLLLTKQKDPESGLAYFNKIRLSGLPNSKIASILSWKAYALLMMGKYDEGIAYAEDAISYAPEFEWTWSIGGRLYSLIRRENDKWLMPSLDFWERYTAKYPDDEDAWAELGFVNWGLKTENNSYSEHALVAFQKALKLGYEDDGLVLDRIGHIFQERNNWAEAGQYFEKAAKQSPGKFGYCYGTSLLFLEKNIEALPWLKNAAENSQSDGLGWSQLANCYMNLGNYDFAEKAFLTALDVEPSYDLAWFNLGGLYWNQKNYGKAKSIWLEAIKKFPENNLVTQTIEYLKLIS